MSEPLLRCGRDPVEVEDHAAAGTLDEHERSCPSSRQVADAVELSAQLAGVVTDAPDAEPPTDLVPSVMRSVRTELRNARQIPLPSPDGAAFVTDHVVTIVLRDRLDAAGGLTVSSCRVELVPGADGGDGGLGVRIEAYARYLQDLVGGADDVRRLVTRVLDREFGLTADAGVDVDVVDLIGPVS